MQRGKIWVEEVPTPEPQQGELLVKTRACGICGSDLHAVAHTEEFVATSIEAGGAFKLTTLNPVVLGHEFCAEVVDYGPGCERHLAPGALVCSVPMLARNTPQAIGYSEDIPGGFGQYMVLSERLTIPVPGGTPVVAAALTEPMAVGLHAVRKARLTGDEAVLVLGCGPVGLAVITALRGVHQGPIVASDFSPRRRYFAERQGAHDCVDPGETSPYEAPQLNNRSLVVFECVGVPGMIDNVFLNVPANSRLVVVGVCLQTDHARPLIAINKELNVQYVLGYTLDEFRETLGFIADGRFDVADLITDQVPLGGVADAFSELASPEHHAKILVTPN